MDKALRNTIIAGIIIIALSLSYYLVIFLPKKEAMRLEQQEQEKGRIEQATIDCSAEAKQKTDEASKEKQNRSYYDTKYMLCLRARGIEK